MVLLPHAPAKLYERAAHSGESSGIRFYRPMPFMKTLLTTFIVAAGLAFPAAGQGFINLNFESAFVVPQDPNFGFLNWNLAAPGWGHSSGADTASVYYRNEHLGLSQYYLLYDSSISPAYAPNTQLAGRYSLGFASGHAHNGTPLGAWTQAFLSQTGQIASDVQSVRFLARGSFAIYVGGVQIPVESLGGNAYAGDISTFAGTTTEFRIVNTSLTVHDPVVMDNIVFSPLGVPEPSTCALVGLGITAAWLACRRKPSK